jgi:hypothetical protein
VLGENLLLLEYPLCDCLYMHCKTTVWTDFPVCASSVYWHCGLCRQNCRIICIKIFLLWSPRGIYFMLFSAWHGCLLLDIENVTQYISSVARHRPLPVYSLHCYTVLSFLPFIFTSPLKYGRYKLYFAGLMMVFLFR